MLRLLKIIILAALLVTPVAWWFKGSLVDRDEIVPGLLRDPVQVRTQAPAFSFQYKGKSCLVRPVTTYELWGLVVSHNNIESFADLYHDSTSVDTKDLCVIWGRNLERDDYQEVSFSSGAFTCYFRYPAGVRFSGRAGSNNHLIADDALVRDQIGNVRVGDQIHLQGMLVNYQMDDWRGFWRESSLVRSDDGCEVVYVEKLEVVRQGTPGWYAIFRAGWITLLVAPLLYLLTAHFTVRRRGMPDDG
jgi:hypothetical protein